VVVRGGWGTVLGLALSCAAIRTEARELRAIDVRPADHGATVVIALTRPAAPRIDVVRGEGGRLRRIHVDLPSGTRLGPGAVGAVTPAPPVGGVRIGLLENARPRVVIEVDGATDYRLEEQGASATLTLTVLGTPPATGDRVVDPDAEPLPPLPPRERRAGGRPKIVLDPGHGGEDPGASGFAIEKDVTLDVARRLAGLLRVRLGAEVVLTRDGDETLALKERTARANAEDADLFVSIHANANPTGRSRGIETYYLDNSTDRGTLRLAKMENGLDLLNPKAGEASLRYILSDLVQVGKMDASVRLARSVQRGLVRHLRRRHADVVDLGVKRGPFYVLVGAYMPCVLVEVAFLSHPVEGRRLARRDYRIEVAEGLYTGVARFLGDTSRRRTL
jgi:N-acetylmuramoyl-L-alanine amidase